MSLDSWAGARQTGVIRRTDLARRMLGHPDVAGVATRWVAGWVVIASLTGCTMRVSPGNADDADDEGDEPDGPLGVDAPRGLLADSSFDLPPFDTGNLLDVCTMQAPAGSASWGVSGASVGAPGERTLNTARFASGGSDGYLYGYHDGEQLGYVRYVQGHVTGMGECGPVAWNRFEPIAIGTRPGRLSVDVLRDTANRFGAASVVRMTVVVWLSSPDLAVAGIDLNGKKPLGLELSVFEDCAPAGCEAESVEDEIAYRYRAAVADLPDRVATEVEIDLQPTIAAAVGHFGLDAAAATLAIYQVELDIELFHAEGAATIDDFVLEVSP